MTGGELVVVVGGAAVGLGLGLLLVALVKAIRQGPNFGP